MSAGEIHDSLKLSSKALVLLLTGFVLGQYVGELKGAFVEKEVLKEKPVAPAVSSPGYVDYHRSRFNFSSWCTSRSVCATESYGTDLCYPCQRRWLVLISSARSGSTTLTEMMGSLTGLRMGGENANAVVLFEELKRTLNASPFRKAGHHGPWRHDWIPPESWSCAGQALLETMIPAQLGEDDTHLAEPDDRTIVGFKTIRLFRKDMDTKPALNGTSWSLSEGYIEDKVRLLTNLFPCARFVGTIRSDNEAQLQSRERLPGIRRTGYDEIFLPREREAIKALIKQLGSERAYLMDSVEWTKNVSKVNDLVQWLGFSSDCRFKELLEYNTGRSKHRRKSIKHNHRCRYTADD